MLLVLEKKSTTGSKINTGKSEWIDKHQRKETHVVIGNILSKENAMIGGLVELWVNALAFNFWRLEFKSCLVR